MYIGNSKIYNFSSRLYYSRPLLDKAYLNNRQKIYTVQRSIALRITIPLCYIDTGWLYPTENLMNFQSKKISYLLIFERKYRLISLLTLWEVWITETRCQEPQRPLVNSSTLDGELVYSNLSLVRTLLQAFLVKVLLYLTQIM